VALPPALLTPSTARAAVTPYTIVALPDTQYYSASYPATFTAQTNWIAANQAAQNIVFVTHEGDLVNTYTNLTEWSNAATAMNVLNTTAIPYATCPGNHDSNFGTSYTNYAANFGPTRYAGDSWYLGASSSAGNNSAVLFQGGTRQYLSLSLDAFQGASAIAWAQQQINSHPGVPTIVTLHSYYNVNGTFTPEGGQFWDGLFKNNSQVFMVLCGHMHGEYADVDYNTANKPVYQMLADYQDSANGGNGYMRLLTFDEAANQIHVKTYSPTLNSYLTGPNSQFDLSINFADRFYVPPPPPPPIPRTLTFNSNIVDTMVRAQYPTIENHAAATLIVDSDDPAGTGKSSQVLLRFEGLFGNGPGQIPLGMQIESAVLTFQTTDPGVGAKFHRMLTPWSDTDTWNNLVGGVSPNGVEAVATADVTTGTISDNGAISFDVLASLQAWSDGQTNYGWALIPVGTDGWRFDSAEGTTPPTLEVTFLVPAPEPATLGLLTLGALALLRRRR
jgi:hypothetical protein